MELECHVVVAYGLELDDGNVEGDGPKQPQRIRQQPIALHRIGIRNFLCALNELTPLVQTKVVRTQECRTPRPQRLRKRLNLITS